MRIAVVNRRLETEPRHEYPITCGLEARGWTVQHVWLDELGSALTGAGTGAVGESPMVPALLAGCAAAIVRSQPGVPMAAVLEAVGIPVVNRVWPRQVADDKWLSAVALEAAGVPQLPSHLWPDPATVLPVTGPIVVKTRTGSLGHGVTRHASLGDARVRFTEAAHGTPLDAAHDAFVVQPYVDAGEDWRVLVADGQVVCWVRRWAAAGEWRTNHALGGHGDAAPLPDGFAEVAQAAAAALGLDLAGVDLIMHEGQAAVLEVNATPGWVDPQRLWGAASYEAYPLAVESRLRRGGARPIPLG